MLMKLFRKQGHKVNIVECSPYVIRIKWTLINYLLYVKWNDHYLNIAKSFFIKIFFSSKEW